MFLDKNEKITRREFLKRAITWLGSVVVAWLAIRPETIEFFSAFKASTTREQPKDLTDNMISDEVMRNTYDKYLLGKEDLIPYAAWHRKEPIQGIAPNLAHLANLYYQKEKKQNESFDDYYERYLGKLSESAQKANLDFATFVTVLQLSGENTPTLKDQKKDVIVSSIQETGMAAAKQLGIEFQMQDLLRPHQEYVAFWAASQLSPVKMESPDVIPAEGTTVNAVIRLDSEPTIGMMDYESSEKAKALLLYSNEEIKGIYMQKYPKIVLAYQEILDILGVEYKPIIPSGNKIGKPNEFSESRATVKQKSMSYVQSYSHHLDKFAKDPKALHEIGIGIPLDPWQKWNRTDIWYELVRNADQADVNKTDELNAVKTVQDAYALEWKSDPTRFYQNIMSQQVRNPKFLDYLLRQSLLTGNVNEMRFIRELRESVRKYETTASAVRSKYYIALAEEGSLEYDSDFQTLSSATIVKMLDTVTGQYVPNDRNSFYWHLWKMIGIREIAHPRTLVRSNIFARDISIDPPYATQETFSNINTLISMLLAYGVISKPPSEDIETFMKVCQTIHRRNKTGEWSGLSDLKIADNNNLARFFKLYIWDTHNALERSQYIVWNLCQKNDREYVWLEDASK